jgi:hypothetical protein
MLQQTVSLSTFSHEVRTANIFSHANCSGANDPPFGVPFISGETLINPLDIVDLIGKAAFCN